MSFGCKIISATKDIHKGNRYGRVFLKMEGIKTMMGTIH
jgi:hypothetical protein